MTFRFKEGLFSASLAAAIGFAAVSTQSLWIDEANSAFKAMAPDIQAFLDAMRAERGSDLQMPLYMLMLWCWEKVFGHSEFALRAMNIPLFAIALMLAVRGWHTSDSQRTFFVIFACSSAFLWAYLDEARPYILQFLGATACTIALANVSGNTTAPRKSDMIILASGVLILCGSSLLGVIFSFWFSAAFLVLWLMRQSLGCILRRPDTRLAIIVCVPALLALASYYLWTLSLGAGASSVGSTDLKSIAYGTYELLGVAGLGPGRGELRVSSMALVPFIAPVLVYIFILVLFLGAGAALALHRHDPIGERKSAAIFWTTAAAMVGSTVLVGIAGDFRVVGRHLTPLLPFALILFSLAADVLWHTRLRMAGRAIAVLAILAMLGSAFSYRTGDRHAKDNYRAAASHASSVLEQGGTVWWAADPAGARYYGLDLGILPSRALESEESSNQAYLAWNVPESAAATLPGIEMVILSKPEIYDEKGTLRKLLASHDYNLREDVQSFRIYTAGSGAASTLTK